MEHEWPPGILATLIDSMTEAVALLDAEGRVMTSNAALSRMSGYTPEDWRGESLGLLFSSPGAATPSRAVLEVALRDGVAVGETTGMRRDGASLWLRYRVVRLPEGAAFGVRRSGSGPGTADSERVYDGCPNAERPNAERPNAETRTPCLLAVAEDVTANAELRFAQSLTRQLLEEAGRREATLTHLNQELAALNDLAATVNQSLDLETVLDAALERALEVAEASTGWMFLVSPTDREELELVAHRGLPVEYVRRHPRSRVSDCLPGKAVITGKPLVLYNLPPDEELTPYLRRQEVRCVAHIPVRNRDRTIGALGIGAPGMRQFSEGLVRFLTSVGHQVGLAIENARLYEQVKLRADLDPLTGLYNRQRFCELLDARVAALRKESAEAAPPNTEFAPWVLMIDIDDFKQINDSYGHDRGDQVLRELAQFLRQSVRGGDIAGRYGGDEFVVALCGDEDQPSDSRARRAETVVERLRLRFAEASRAGCFSTPLAVSIGGARSAASSQDCLKLADEAMYREKRRRKRAAARSRGAEKGHSLAESAPGESRGYSASNDTSSGEPITALRRQEAPLPSSEPA
jgi:diguanylate cyclase (GGDEF)-like protein/PAS domain S-box-containing protein